MNNLPAQLLSLVLMSIVILLIQRLLHFFWPKRLRYYDFWPLLTLYLSVLNLSLNWFAYAVIGWTLIGIILVIGIIIRQGELLYRQFSPIFWRFTVVYSTIVYICSIIYRFMG